MALRPGSMANFPGSMAAAIEAELHALLVADGMPGLPRDNSPESRDVRRLLVAIARGVVSHIDANAGAFRISYRDGGTIRQTSPDVQVDAG